MKKEMHSEKSDSVEPTDYKKDIHRFIEVLYGNSISNSHFVIWTKQDKQSRSYSSLDQIVEQVKLLRDSHDVYFEVGLQATAPDLYKRGRQDEVTVLPGLWMDIDIKGPGHKQSDLPRSWGEAFEIIDAVGVKPSIIVKTGGGMHVYWLFSKPWLLETDAERASAMDLSKRFQHFVIGIGRRLGYELDCTGDLSRLLRLPGTINHKGDPVLVEIADIDESCRYEPNSIQERLFNLDVQDLKNELSEENDIYEGKRNSTLASIAGKLRASGKEVEKIKQELAKINQDRCKPPLSKAEVDQIVASIGEYPPNASQQPTQAQRLVSLADGMEFFHSPDGEAYAVLKIEEHKEVWPLKSKAVRHYLDRLYNKENGGGVPGAQARQDALNILEGCALYESPEKQVHVRVAEHDGSLYLDLCNKAWEFVKIDQNGWEIVTDPPVAFRRSKGMGELPVPQPGGSIKELFRFINADDANRCLLVAYLVTGFRPGHPFPILILQGEQGSAKSTTAKIVRDLIDPSTAPLRTLPRGDRDLMVSANNSWILAYDNLSGVSTSMSDALCRISTGGGFSARELYTDGEEKIFDSMRPVVLNGIDDIANRGDLADRALILNLPRISKSQRRLESELWREFRGAKPRILGALLDAVSLALRRVEFVRLENLPRMADFAQWVVAAEPALTWESGYFMKVYGKNQVEASQNVLESDPVARVLQEFVGTKKTWYGSASELLRALDDYVEEDRIRYGKSWPKTASYLSGRVRRIAPLLREAGYTVVNSVNRGKRIWKLEAAGV